jgi:quinol monooxygenase YgiN
MSVIVIIQMKADPANVERLWQERAADFEAVSTVGKAAGAIHHRWGFGDGEVVIIDEWPDAESFHGFFSSQPKIAELMAAGGVQGPPDITILEARTAPDEF